MSALQEPVLSDEFILKATYFDINTGEEFSIGKVKAKHLIAAHHDSPPLMLAKLITLCVRKDNNPISADEVMNLDVYQFNEIGGRINQILSKGKV